MSKKPSKAKKLKARRERLWRANPHCVFCGVLTVLPDAKNGHDQHPKSNWATIEHLRSLYHPLRQEPNLNKEPRTVLCCWACNNNRNKQEEARLPREVLQQRSPPKRKNPKGEEVKRAFEEVGIEYHKVRNVMGKRARTAASRFMQGIMTYEQLVTFLKETYENPDPKRRKPNEETTITRTKSSNG